MKSIAIFLIACVLACFPAGNARPTGVISYADLISPKMTGRRPNLVPPVPHPRPRVGTWYLNRDVSEFN
ncbi:hypothetical protein PGT21_019074 [Puccinia graminis f. sp. tritici]|uniref:Uncharacterized protein n=1 Tax=Puccinia graminis f. sp. tritici TaxID=56615 RepID=A0A5B0QIV7_PUCGR|nr:hypothetical protein PGT21_019074 [Puccinia graminis f. sp. tritici]